MRISDLSPVSIIVQNSIDGVSVETLPHSVGRRVDRSSSSVLCHAFPQRQTQWGSIVEIPHHIQEFVAFSILDCTQRYLPQSQHIIDIGLRSISHVVKCLRKVLHARIRTSLASLPFVCPDSALKASPSPSGILTASNA